MFGGRTQEQAQQAALAQQQQTAQQAAARPSRSRTGPSAGFVRPEEVPWSVLGPEFIERWMPRPDPGEEFQGEHMEVSGQTGSGKSYTMATLLHMRALARDTPTIYICTKKDDATMKRLSALGWPIVTSIDEIKRYRQVIYWPQTNEKGLARKAFYNVRIYRLLTWLWVEKCNTVVAFDEIGFVESLSADLKAEIENWWREARGLGIGMAAMKQRPVGVARDQHSESRWKFVFPPAHFADMEVFAMLLGRPGDWQPVLESLDQTKHQFVVRNSVTREQYISWIDFPLERMRLLEQDKRMSPSEKLYGRRTGQKVR